MNIKRLLLASTALIGFALPAEAGPIAGVFAWIGSTLAAGGVGAFLLSTGLSMGLNAIAGALFKPEDEQKFDVNFEVQMGDVLPLSFIVGDYVTAGKRKYIGSWGRNTRFITEVIEVSALPQGMDAIWINDEKGVPVENRRAYIGGSNPSDDRTWTEGTSVPAGSIDIGQPYSNMSDDGNRITVKWLDGNQTVADPFLRAVFGDDEDYPWTANMIGRGKSIAIITTRFDDDTLTDYPKFLFKPSPLPMYDWRKDSTNGGNGTHRWGNRSTYQPTNNPMVIAYNVARGIYWGDEWVYGGKNLQAWRLPIAEWTAAANAADEPVTISGGATEKRYRAGSEVKVDRRPLDFLDELAKGSNARFAEVGGRLKPIVDLPGASVLSITDGDILISQGQTYNPFYPLSDTYNAVSATYPEPSEKWTMKDAPEYVDAAATAEDRGEYLPVQMSYPTVPYARQVQRLMRSQMRDFRRMRRHSFHLPPAAYLLEPAIDMISWTSNRNGYINKKFIIEKVTKLPGMNVLVDVREVDNSDYDWSIGFERPVTVTSPKNPVPYVQNIFGFNAEASTLRTAAGQPRRPTIRVWCNSDEVNVDRLQVQARIKGTTEITLAHTFVYEAPFSWHVTDPLPLQTYEVRGKLIPKNRKRKSNWSGWIEVTTSAGSNITIEDMTEDFIESMREIAQKAGVTPVDTLPAAGEFPDQIVMKVPEGLLYRWDAVAGEWVESLFGGIPDGYLDETKFAQGIEPTKIIPDGQPLPTTKSTTSIVWNGALYTWNGTQYTAPSFSLTPGIVQAVHIANSAVTLDKILNGSVTAVKLANGAVTRDKILDGAITDLKIANGAITDAKIAGLAAGKITGQLTDAQIFEVSSAKLAGQITGPQIANSAITDAKIAGMNATKLAGQVVATQIADNSITTPKVVAGAIEAGKLAVGSVTATKIGAGAVETEKLAALAVDAGKIAADAVTAVKISAGAVETAKLAAGSVVADKIATNAVTAVKISAGAIETAKLAAGSVVADKIATGAVVAEKVAALAITADKIATNAIIARTISAGAVGADQIAAKAIIASKLAISDFENFILNDRWDTLDGWTLGGTGVVQADLTSIANATASNGLNFTNTSAVTYAQFGSLADPTVVKPGDELAFGVRIRGSGTGAKATAYFRADFFDKNNASVANPVVNSSPNESASFRDFTGSLKVPEGAVKAYWRFGRRGDFAGETNSMYMELPYIRRKNGGELIVDGAITANKIEALTITSDHLATNSVTAGKITSNSIESRHIVTDAITTAKLAAGAVRAEQIAAGAIIASKLAVSDFTNLILNPDARGGSLDGWENVHSSITTTARNTAAGQSNAVRTMPSAYAITFPTASIATSAWPATLIPTKPGEEFHIEFDYAGSGENINNTLQARFTFRNSAGVDISTIARSVTVTASGWRTTDFAGVVAPAGADILRVVSIQQSAAGAGGPTHVTNLRLNRKNGGQLIVDGTITANKLATDSVTANAIAAGAIVASHIAAGTITANRLNITNLSSISANMGLITAGTIRSGASGGRFQLDTEIGLRIWDDSGSLRVILGKIS